MERSERFLRRGAAVFAVLAWLSLVLQACVGVYVLVTGGPPVPMGDLDVPARVVGILNLVAAGIYFFLFMFLRHLTRLLLALYGQVTKGQPAGG